MSKLCAYLVAQGCVCTGSDAVYCDNITMLRDIGVNICIGVDEQLAKAADIVVYNAAISPTHKERLVAKLSIERKELLGMVESQFDCKIAVAGAHGKTSVSGMLAYIIKELGLDAMAHVGGDIIGLNPLQVPSKNGYIITEACEYSRSFLQLSPDIGIIVNIDYDHPDCYRDIEDTYDAFAKFLINTQKYALVDKSCYDKIMCLTRGKLPKYLKVMTFGDTDASDYYPSNITRQGIGYKFILMHGNENLGEFFINSVNAINVRCATIALATCHIMGLSVDRITAILAEYKGVKRRMEYLGMAKNGAAVYTDYAHHPKELLSLCNNLPKDIMDNATIIFQPHTYSRTAALLQEFIFSLSQYSSIIILPTYPARELPSQGVSGEQLYHELIKSGVMCEYFHEWEQLIEALADKKNTDTILLVGAGIDYSGIFQLLK